MPQPDPTTTRQAIAANLARAEALSRAAAACERAALLGGPIGRHAEAEAARLRARQFAINATAIGASIEVAA